MKALFFVISLILIFGCKQTTEPTEEPNPTYEKQIAVKFMKYVYRSQRIYNPIIDGWDVITDTTKHWVVINETKVAIYNLTITLEDTTVNHKTYYTHTVIPPKDSLFQVANLHEKVYCTWDDPYNP
jgi:hypothetical protein